MPTSWKPNNSILLGFYIFAAGSGGAEEKMYERQMYENIKVVIHISILFQPLNLAKIFCYISVLIR